MPLDIIVGAQWGDEGKGRIVDLLARQAAIVARYNGGDNAGHTVTVSNQTFKLHLVPSGVIHSHTIAAIGNGVVVNPATLIAEMETLRKAGVQIDPQRLRLSYAAHLITPAHRALDAAQEGQRGAAKIGTTLRGIGPTFADKASRTGLRLGQMLEIDTFTQAVRAHVESVNQRLTKLYQAEPLDGKTIEKELFEYAQILKPYIQDVSAFLAEALAAGKAVLAEGAQGTLLDLDHGTYPFVTSSTPTAPGAFTGLGVGVGCEGRVVGVTKAFQTRVGSGPFPTELEGDLATHLRGTGSKPWDEFGTTTGRPRRVGWLDIVLLRYAVRINGLTELALTKLDILSGLPVVKICVGYRKGDQVYSEPYFGPSEIGQYEPVYEEIPGWDADLWQIRRWADLPLAARNYIERIVALTKTPIKLVSVGPERDQIVDVA